MAVTDDFAGPRMAAYVDPYWARVTTDAALDAASSFGDHVGFDQELVTHGFLAAEKRCKAFHSHLQMSAKAHE